MLVKYDNAIFKHASRPGKLLDLRNHLNTWDPFAISVTLTLYSTTFRAGHDPLGEPAYVTVPRETPGWPASLTRPTTERYCENVIPQASKKHDNSTISR